MGCQCSCQRQEDGRCCSCRCCCCYGLCCVRRRCHRVSSTPHREVSQSAGLLVDLASYPVMLDIQNIQGGFVSEGNLENHQLARTGSGRLVHPEQHTGLAASVKVVDADDQVTLKKKKCDSTDSINVPTSEEDSCPICLDEYDFENPKMMTVCEHHFHLGCILEWMEKSDSCPICDKEMMFTESSY